MLNNRPRLFRAQGLVKPSVLCGKKLVVVGAGNVGSHMLQAIPFLLLGKIVLIDPDCFAIENIERHILDESEVGYPKVDGLARWLAKRRMPTDRIQTHASRVEDVLDGHTDADLIIETTGSTSGAREYVNRVTGCPVLYVGVYPMDRGGQVVAVTNKDGACYVCAQHMLGRVTAPEQRHCGDGDEELVVLEERDKLVAVPHLNWSTMVVAGLAGEMALNLLQGRNVPPQILRFLNPWQPLFSVQQGTKNHGALAGFVRRWGKLGFLPHLRLGKAGEERVLSVRKTILSRPLVRWNSCPFHETEKGFSIEELSLC